MPHHDELHAFTPPTATSVGTSAGTVPDGLPPYAARVTLDTGPYGQPRVVLRLRTAGVHGEHGVVLPDAPEALAELIGGLVVVSARLAARGESR